MSPVPSLPFMLLLSQADDIEHQNQCTLLFFQIAHQQVHLALNEWPLQPFQCLRSFYPPILRRGFCICKLLDQHVLHLLEDALTLFDDTVSRLHSIRRAYPRDMILIQCLAQLFQDSRGQRHMFGDCYDRLVCAGDCFAKCIEAEGKADTYVCELKGRCDHAHFGHLGVIRGL